MTIAPTARENKINKKEIKMMRRRRNSKIKKIQKTKDFNINSIERNFRNSCKHYLLIIN